MSNRNTFKVRTNLEYEGQSYGPDSLANIDAVTAAKLLEMRAIEAAPVAEADDAANDSRDDTLIRNAEASGDQSE